MANDKTQATKHTADIILFSTMAAYVWINGFQGVGKLTAAKHLQALLPGSILLDNHSLIDVVTLPRDHPDYYSERKKARQAAFAKYVYPDDNFTLTKPIIATGT